MQEGQATLPIGAVIRGHYVVENVLNKGNAGAIYLVTDQRFTYFCVNYLSNAGWDVQRHYLRFSDECEHRPVHHQHPTKPGEQGNPCPRAPGSYGIWNVTLA